MGRKVHACRMRKGSCFVENPGVGMDMGMVLVVVVVVVVVVVAGVVVVVLLCCYYPTLL